MSIDPLTAFFAWCTLINLALMSLTVLLLILFRGPISNLHSRLMNVPAADLPRLYFHYLGTYKIVFLVFNLVPYLALKIIG